MGFKIIEMRAQSDGSLRVMVETDLPADQVADHHVVSVEHRMVFVPSPGNANELSPNESGVIVVRDEATMTPEELADYVREAVLREHPDLAEDDG